MKNKKTSQTGETLDFIIKRLNEMCVYFCAFMTIPVLFFDNGVSKLYIYLVLFASVALSFIGLVMKIKNMSYAIKLTLHMILTYAAFTVVFLTVSGRNPNDSLDNVTVIGPKTYAILAMLIAVLYAIFGTAGYFIQRGRTKKQSADNYKKQFKK